MVHFCTLSTDLDPEQIKSAAGYPDGQKMFQA
jgi:hypothetical protein